MSSTRKLCIASLCAVASICTGCTTAPKPEAEAESGVAMPIDEAMARRDWPQSTAAFANGDTVAGATRFAYVPQTEGEGAGKAALGPERSNAVLDNVFFITQSLWLPFTYIAEPPFVKKVYQGAIYEPTYTAMPVLPGDEAPVETGSVPPLPPPDVDAEETIDESTVLPSQKPLPRPSASPSAPVDAEGDPVLPEPTNDGAADPRTLLPAQQPEAEPELVPVPDPVPASSDPEVIEDANK